MLEKESMSRSVSGFEGSLEERLRSLGSVVVYGAGGAGLRVLARLRSSDVDVVAFADSNPTKWGTTVSGLPVLSPRDPTLIAHHVVIASKWARDIAIALARDEVRDFFSIPVAEDILRFEGHFSPQSIREGIHRVEALAGVLDPQSRDVIAGILEFRRTLDPRCLRVASFEQYMHPSYRPRSGDIVVDGGGWTADTALEFRARADGAMKIFCFEPHPGNARRARQRVSDARLSTDVEVVELGLWNCPARLPIEDALETGAECRVGVGSGSTAELVALDAFLDERGRQHIDVFKLDVEGAEREAIDGAARTISRCKPRLMFSIYHRAGDIAAIFEQVLAIVPDYRFEVHHHSQDIVDTILYGACP